MNQTVTIPTWLLVLAIIAVIAWSCRLAYRAAFWRDMVKLMQETSR